MIGTMQAGSSIACEPLSDGGRLDACVLPIQPHLKIKLCVSICDAALSPAEHSYSHHYGKSGYIIIKKEDDCDCDKKCEDDDDSCKMCDKCGDKKKVSSLEGKAAASSFIMCVSMSPPIGVCCYAVLLR